MDEQALKAELDKLLCELCFARVGTGVGHRPLLEVVDEICHLVYDLQVTAK